METPRCFSHVELTGGRARLRPIKPDDAPAAYDLFRDDRVVRTLLVEAPANLQEEEAWAGRASEFPMQEQSGWDAYSLAIESLDKPGLIGVVSLHQRNHPQQLEIGYWLGVPYWGQGFMTDAARLAVHFAFQHLDAARVFATVFVGNAASRRVLEKNGFHLEGTLRQHVQKRGEWLDEWFFSLLRAEWEARRDWYRPQEERVVVGR